MGKASDLSESTWMRLLTEKRQNLDSDLQQCNHALEKLSASQGMGGSAEQIGRWETIKDTERQKIALESKLELLDELLTQARIAQQQSL